MLINPSFLDHGSITEMSSQVPIVGGHSSVLITPSCSVHSSQTLPFATAATKFSLKFLMSRTKNPAKIIVNWEAGDLVWKEVGNFSSAAVPWPLLFARSFSKDNLLADPLPSVSNGRISSFATALGEERATNYSQVLFPGNSWIRH